MTKIEELYKNKGQAHTQIEIWQQMLKEANQALSQELAKNPGGLNGEVKQKVSAEKDMHITEKSKI